MRIKFGAVEGAVSYYTEHGFCKAVAVMPDGSEVELSIEVEEE